MRHPLLKKMWRSLCSVSQFIGIVIAVGLVLAAIAAGYIIVWIAGALLSVFVIGFLVKLVWDELQGKLEDTS